MADSCLSHCNIVVQWSESAQKAAIDKNRPEADIHGAGRHADAIKLIAEHDGAFLSILLLWSSFASRFIIVGNQDVSFVKSWMRLPIGVGQSIGQILRVGNQSRCGRCVR